MTIAVLVAENGVYRQEKVWPLLENGQVFAPNVFFFFITRKPRVE